MTNELKKEFTLRISQANHSGMILILCDMEKVYVGDAITAYEEGDDANYLIYVNYAKKVHNELMSCFATNDSLGIKVLNILRFIYKKLVESSVKQCPCDLDRCMNMMDNLREGFVRLHEIDDEGPVMRNTQQVYAGLTYGKGTLNESFGKQDYSNRGFKV